MTDYYTTTVVQPAIPATDITPLERLLLSHIFHAQPDGDALYFYADEGPADTVWLDRGPVEAALAQSKSIESTAVTVVTEQLARLPADNAELELDCSDDSCWQSIFQDIVRRSNTLRYITAVSAFTCSKMLPHGFGGMAVVITASDVMDKTTGDIMEDFLNEAVPDWEDQSAQSFALPR